MLSAVNFDWITIWTFCSFIAIAGTGAVALFGIRRSSVDQRQARELATRQETLRFTDKQISAFVAPEIITAQYLLFQSPLLKQNIDMLMTAKEKQQSTFEADVAQWRHYNNAIGRYENLLDRVAMYSEAGVVDEELLFSQYAYTIVCVYVLLRDDAWLLERTAQTPRVLMFATRAYFYFSEHHPGIAGEIVSAFFTPQLARFYPSARFTGV